MNNPIKQVLGALKSVLCSPDGNVCIRGSDADRYIVQMALLRLEGLEKAEPLGYVSEHNCEGPYKFQFKKTQAEVYLDNCKSITPVYTAPPAAPVAKLEPLSDAEIDAWWSSENGLEDCVMSKQLDFRMVVRAVEAAHNAKLGNK